MERPFTRRHARLDEQVATMRRVWTGEPPSEGVGTRRAAAGASRGARRCSRRRWDRSRWRARPGGPTVWPGSTSRRIRPASPPAFRHFERAWADAGRDGAPFRQTSFWFGLDADAPDARARLRVPLPAHLRRRRGVARWPGSCTRLRRPRCGTASTALADAGCDEAMLVATTADLDELRGSPNSSAASSLAATSEPDPSPEAAVGTS